MVASVSVVGWSAGRTGASDLAERAIAGSYDCAVEDPHARRGKGRLMEDRSRVHRSRLPRVPKALVVTVLGTLVTAWLIPALTRQWQDQQRAQELKAAIVTRIGRDTTEALMLSSFIANGRFEPVRDEEVPFRVPMKAFNDLDLNWERNRREIGAQLEAYFSDGDIVKEWRSYGQLTRDTYWLITQRKWKRPQTVDRLQRRLPRRHRCQVESLRQPFPTETHQHAESPGSAAPVPCEPEELRKARSNYSFVAAALLEAKSNLTEKILDADPDGLSTDTSDFFQDLIPLV
jgi:hypothetical protein